MTQWAFAVGEIEPPGLAPAALILPVSAFVADLPGDEPRRLWRRHVLTVLAMAALGWRDDEVDLVTGADGRRRLGDTGLFASVTHRAGWVAAVLGHVPVGIDLEAEDEASDASNVILAGVDPDFDLVGWHGLAGVWAAREAVLKAQGRDLTRDHRRWRFGTGWVRGDDEPALRVDLARRPGMVAAVAYVGD